MQDELLTQLKEELKRPKRDEAKLEELANSLVKTGVYPAYGANGKYSALDMAKSYGADWHIFREMLECPQCHADLCDHIHGPPFKREIGWYQDDRTTHYICPDCHKIIWRLAPRHTDPTPEEIEKFFENY